MQDYFSPVLSKTCELSWFKMIYKILYVHIPVHVCFYELKIECRSGCEKPRVWQEYFFVLHVIVWPKWTGCSSSCFFCTLIGSFSEHWCPIGATGFVLLHTVKLMSTDFMREKTIDSPEHRAPLKRRQLKSSHWQYFPHTWPKAFAWHEHCPHTQSPLPLQTGPPGSRMQLASTDKL